MPVLRDPRSGVVVHVDDGTAAALGWPLADASPPSGTECGVCGFVAKTDAGLKSHLRSHER